ncbi:hypothetical protein FPOA_12007 [Fusarium poae]|uniref:C2H2-type domain-containing protein n=1 Tax=Fusarium poae TaxID=36050 RepID=A0A1B8AAN2_FUSPO|nr:hypothetical protein FPOA_12007 [Fusarium poae]
MRPLEDDVSETSTSSTSSPLLTLTSTEFFESYPSPMQTPYSSVPDVSDLIQAVNRRLGGANGFTRCPLCPRRRTRTFGPGALQQHLSSGFHSKTLPTTVGSSTRKPPKTFSTVSGLAQHVESGACYGGNFKQGWTSYERESNR